MAKRKAQPRNDKDKKACPVSGKVCYSTRKAAAGSSNTVSKLHDKEINFYKCPHCSDWHLTRRSQDGEKERSATDRRTRRPESGNEYGAGWSSHSTAVEDNRPVPLGI